MFRLALWERYFLDAWFFFSWKFEAEYSQEKKSWKAYAWYRKHIKITQNGFFDRAHAFDAVISPLQQFIYPLFFNFFFQLSIGLLHFSSSYLFFFFTSVLFFSFCEFCVGIQWKKTYLLMQVNIQARTYKKNSSFFSLISLNRNIERSTLLSRAHNIHMAL